MTSKHPEVSTVTTAGLSRADDQRRRQRRYLAMQAVRLACVLLAALLPIGLWWKAAFIVGSVVLPWIGVVGANAAPNRRAPRTTSIVARPEESAAVEPPRLEILPGRVVDQDGRDVA